MTKITTLAELSKEIDQYIDRLDQGEKFDLLGVKSILERYTGVDWLNYRPCEKCNKCQLTKKDYRRMPINLPCLHQKSYDFYLLVWKPNVETGIHDHPRNGCLLKVLDGEIHEDRYSTTGEIIKSTDLKKDDIGYMHDKIGYHKIRNPVDEVAYSLHIYSPIKYIPRVYQLDDLTPACQVDSDNESVTKS